MNKKAKRWAIALAVGGTALAVTSGHPIIAGLLAACTLGLLFL